LPGVAAAQALDTQPAAETAVAAEPVAEAVVAAAEPAADTVADPKPAAKAKTKAKAVGAEPTKTKTKTKTKTVVGANSKAKAKAVIDAEPDLETVAQVTDWIAASRDNGTLPFVIIDKVAAEVFVFGADGQFKGAAPALLGSARGDRSWPGVGDRELSNIPPNQRTTPAGRFIAAFGPAAGGKNVLWVDYKTAISLHAVIVANPNQHRFERLKSPTPKDNRITFGCINVPAAFYKNVVSPAFKGTSGIVYILPEKLPLAKILPGFHSQHADAAPQQAAAEVAAADAEQDHGASDVAAADVAANAEADHATSEVAAADVAPAAEPVHATSDAAAADVAASDLAASDADRAATEAAADHGPALRPYQPLPVAAEAQPEPAPADAAADSGPALRPYQPLPAAPGADPDRPIPTAAADSAPAPR